MYSLKLNRNGAPERWALPAGTPCTMYGKWYQGGRTPPPHLPCTEYVYKLVCVYSPMHETYWMFDGFSFNIHFSHVIWITVMIQIKSCKM